MSSNELTSYVQVPDEQQRLKREKEERELAWKMLCLQPEFLNDLDRLKKNPSNEEKEFIKVWGFIPDDPSKDGKPVSLEKPSFSFTAYFSTYKSNVSTNERAIYWDNIKTYDESPLITIKLTIDLTFNESTICNELMETLRSYKERKNLETRENRSSYDHREYIVSCLLRRGVPSREIVNRFIPPHLKELKSKDPERRPIAQAINYLIRKHKEQSKIV